MTNEEKELLIKDLCARLPYGVQLQMFAKEFDGKVYEHPCELDTEILQIMIDNEDIVYLPYLRPMSSMTEEERKELEELTGGDEISISGFGIRVLYGGCYGMMWDDCSEIVDWLNAHHFDYRGLIDLGLAEPAPSGIYDIK